MLSNRNLFFKHVGQTSPFPLAIEVDRAEGVWLYGPGNRRYLDLVSGVSVSNVGHSHPEVIEAVVKQVSNYMHLMVYGEIIQSPQSQYAAALSECLPRFAEAVYFVNSGSEAIEGAIKLARRTTGRSRLVSFRNAYHGSTCGALSIQGAETFKGSFRPLMPDTYLATFNDASSLEIIDRSCAAVIIEPVQGEAGIIYPEEGFLDKVRRRCDDTGAMLVFDEVQTGFGRTGLMFAMEHYKVHPDILVLGKALGGGLPLGAFVARREVMNNLTNNPVLGHITTFGGHPVCCAAGMAALNIIRRENLHTEAVRKGERLLSSLSHPAIKSKRGRGLYLAVQLQSSDHLNRFIDSGADNGMILDRFLFCDDAFRITPPLTISDEEIDTAVDMLITALDKL